MKKYTILTTVMAILLIVAGTMQYVHAKDAPKESKRLCIFLNDNTILSFSESEIDSITTSVSERNGETMQNFWKKDGHVSYPISRIDSIRLIKLDYSSTQEQYDKLEQMIKDGDYDNVFDEALEPAMAGNDSAQFALGLCYEYEMGTEYDLEKAREWYTKAAELGNKVAIERLEELSKTPDTQIELPQGNDMNYLEVKLLNDGGLYNVNGDGTFCSKGSDYVAMNKDDELLYISYGSKTGRDKTVLNARETAVSFLLWSFPLAFQVQDDPVFDEIKSAIGELAETQRFADSIEKCISRKGYLDFDEVKGEAIAASQAISTALGLESLKEIVSYKVKMRHGAPNKSVMEPVGEKVSIKAGSYYYGVKTVLNDAIFDPDLDTWHCNFTIYNENPIYLAIAPGVINPATGEISLKTDNILANLLPPQNSSYIYDMAGLGGVTKMLDSQGKYWRDTYNMFKKAANEGWSGFADGLQEGYWNATHKSFSMDVSSPNDIITITSTNGWQEDSNRKTLLAYSLVDLLVFPTIKQFVKVKDDTTTGAMYNALMTYMLKPSRMNKIISAIPDEPEVIFDVIEEIIEDFVNGVTDNVFDTYVENHLFPGLEVIEGETTVDQIEGSMEYANLLREYKAWKTALKGEKLIINLIAWYAYQSTFQSFYITLNVPEVTDKILITKLWFEQTTLTLNVDDYETILAHFEPLAPDNRKLQWSSSDLLIVSVDENGIVHALKPGTCTITAKTTDGSGLSANCDVTVKGNEHPSADTHEYVDLGLPSGTLWATCNIGANSPEEYGDYFAWGETVPEHECDWDTYKWCNGTKTSMNKYCTQSRDGSVDDKIVLDLEDDAAHVIWQGDWRMPTEEERKELRDNCKWKWENDKNGITVTGPNGNSIFFPAAGRWVKGKEEDVNEKGYYWTSTLNKTYCYLSHGMAVSKAGWFSDFDTSRFCCLSIRPVMSKKQNEVHEYVDLGLPSGTLWATCNVGANSPEEYGDYFAWGETKPKSNYSWSTYFDTTDGGKTFGKYNHNGKKILDPEDDAAFASWGEDWRMPTENEFEELRTECTWTWNSSKKGYDVVGPNKKAIFIPATGHILNSSGNSVGQTGNYWVNSLDDNKSNLSVDFHFSSSVVDWNYDDRYHGHSVRPVYDKKQEPQTGTHEYVDLGLSVKWATCNVGANSPEEYGNYFAWGETKLKEVYDWSTYKWCNGSIYAMTKYCTNWIYGTIDDKITLELADDAAYKNWGGSWRMPTRTEQDELREKCTWTWTTLNGKDGCLVTSNINGNSIFLPAAGRRDEGSLYYAGSNGYYWSSSLYPGVYTLGADELNFNSSGIYLKDCFRSFGLSVRAVYDPSIRIQGGDGGESQGQGDNNNPSDGNHGTSGGTTSDDNPLGI